MRRGLGVILAVTAALVGESSAGTGAPRIETGFLDRVVVDGEVTRRYQVYVPRDYAPDRRWPVILSLHGGGEAGNDGLVQTEVGLGTAIRRHAARWPAIVVFPQLRPGTRWNGPDAAWALAALAQTEREFATDPARVYLTGLSRGGAGTYYLAYRDPDRFAALLAICGRVTPAPTLDGRAEPDRDPIVPDGDGEPFGALGARLKRVPTWIFHGDADDIIPVDESRRAARALRAAGGQVTFTELPGVGHGSWDAAYGREDVAGWLFAQRRPAHPPGRSGRNP